jgi:hypothetical protein
MPIIQDVSVFWVKLNPAKPERYQGKGPAKNTVQIRVYERAKKDQLEKEYGFKFTPKEDATTGKLYYQTSISAFTYGTDADKNEDTNNQNKPVEVRTADLRPLDPDTVGNGSIANIRFRMKDDKSSRTITGMQVTKLVVYKGREEEEFTRSDNFEIIGDAGDSTGEEY